MKPQFQVPPHENEPKCFYLVVALIWGLIQMLKMFCFNYQVVAGQSCAKNGVSCYWQSLLTILKVHFGSVRCSAELAEHYRRDIVF